MKTFIFKSERNWLRVWDALNDTMYSFASYGTKAITVFDEKVAAMLEEELKENRIAFTVID